MNILITGASGLVGSRIAWRLNQIGHKLRLASREPEKISYMDCEIVNSNWQDEESLYRACKGVDVVVHAAGMNAADCAADPVAAFEINGLGTARLGSAALRAGVSKLIYFSTAHVYANPLIGIISEDTCPSNFHPYASSHLAGEYGLRPFAKIESMNVVILRMSNAFGAPLRSDTNCWSLLVNDLCRQYAEKGRLVLSTSGQQWRDFIPLSAVSSVIVDLLSSEPEHAASVVLNLGGISMPVIDMVENIRLRIATKYGQLPPLTRPANHSKREAIELKFKHDKIMNFVSSLNFKIEDEIDALLEYCTKCFNKKRSMQ
jgi:UDP-glucose 4-epimerase